MGRDLYEKVTGFLEAYLNALKPVGFPVNNPTRSFSMIPFLLSYLGVGISPG